MPLIGLETIATRRSIRRYRREAVPERLVDTLLQAMACAPSAHNRQPWRVARIESAEWKQRLARAMGDRLRADRRADGDAEAEIERDVDRSHARITEAPVVLVLCLDMADMDGYADDRRRNAEYLMAVQSVAMAAQNLLLAAHAEGIGACWMCAPLFCPDTVASTLSLPRGWEPQALITLGRPADAGKPRPRRPLDAFVWRPDTSI